MDQLPDQGFMRLPEIIGCRKRGIPALIPVSKSAWWSGVGVGRFPAGVKLGPRTTAWSVKTVRELLARFATAER